MATKDEGVEQGSVSRRRLSRYGEKTLLAWAVIRGTEEVRDPQTWDWLKRGAVKKDTVDILTAAQDQGLPTNYIKNMIELTGKIFHRCVVYGVKGRKLSAI